MITADQIKEAMRNLDAMAEEQANDPGQLAAQLGADPAGLTYCAMQHGLRAALLAHRGEAALRALSPTAFTGVSLTDAEQATMFLTGAAFLNGFTVALRCARDENRSHEDWHVPLTESEKANFETLLSAASNEDLALVRSGLKSTGEPAALLCAVMGESDGTVEMVPLGLLIPGDPYELFEAPDA